MPWDRRQRTGSTGSDDHNVGREPATLDGDAPVAKLGAAFEISDGIIGRQQVHILCLPQLGDQRILAALDRPPILHSGLGVDPAKAYGSCGVMQPFRRPDQILRRHAAGVDAGAADRPEPDQRDAGAELGGGDRRREAGRTRPDNREIVWRLIAHCFTWSRRPRRSAAKGSPPESSPASAPLRSSCGHHRSRWRSVSHRTLPRSRRR